MQTLKYLNNYRRDRYNYLSETTTVMQDGNIYRYADTDSQKNLETDCVWVSIYADEATDQIGMVLMLTTLNGITFPLESWASGENFLFWEPLLEWKKQHPGLRFLVSPVDGPDTEKLNTWRSHPIGEFIEEAWKQSKQHHESNVNGDVAAKFFPFIFRAKLQGLLKLEKFDWRYFAEKEKVVAKIERGSYLDPVVAALAQGICSMPKNKFVFGQSRAYWR